MISIIRSSLLPSIANGRRHNPAPVVVECPPYEPALAEGYVAVPGIGSWLPYGIPGDTGGYQEGWDISVVKITFDTNSIQYTPNGPDGTFGPPA